jgi:hypothetical protein
VCGVQAAFAFLFALYGLFAVLLGVVHLSGQPKTLVFSRDTASDE